MTSTNRTRRSVLRQAATDALRAARPGLIENLESRRLLAAPEIAPLPFTMNAPAGKSILLPVNTTDADGDAVTLTATVTNSSGAGQASAEFVAQDNTWLAMNVRDYGTMVFQLFDDIAPETVRRITGLADTGFYDGLQIFRVIEDFVFQFGSPTNNGQSGPNSGLPPDFTFDDEFDPDTLFTGDGQLAMANSGKDTNSSQFFVTDDDTRFLDGNHTIWGQLVRGFNVRDAITSAPTTTGDVPLTPIVVDQVRTIQNETDGVLRFTPQAGTAGQTFEVTVTATDENNESSTRSFTIGSVNDTVDSPPVLLPLDTTRVTGANQAITIDIPAADPEGDELNYVVDLINPATGAVITTPGTLSLDEDNQTVTYTPANGFTGPATIRVQVEQEGATGRGSTADTFDRQLITVGVGDSGAAGTSRTLRALADAELEDVVVATFTDLDASGSADDWSATIDWGDGESTTGTIVPGSTAGTFDVIGTHTYDMLASDIPVTVNVVGDLGAEIEILSEVDIQNATSLASNGTLTINGSSAADTISVGFDGSQVSVTVNGETTPFSVDEVNLIEIVADAGDDAITLEDDAPGARIFAGEGDDTVRGSLAGDEIFGQEGGDDLDGNGGNDYMDGGAGDDYLMGGTDILYTEDDYETGYFDRDTLIGGAGNDTLSGGLDVNTLDGGDGNDLLNGSGSRDTLVGGAGSDTLRGWGNDDLLQGGDGSDLLEGDDPDDPIRGGEQHAGNDTLEGGNGNDILFGYWGDDLFRGGSGADSLFGGDGDDTDEEGDDDDVLDSIENTPDVPVA